MSLDQALKIASELNHEDLTVLTDYVVDKVKRQMKVQSQMTMGKLFPGCRVRINKTCRKIEEGTEGRVVEIRRTRAVVEINNRRWIVPANLLDVV